MKFQIVNFIRAIGLLTAADAVKFRIGQFRARSRNKTFGREFPGFATPPEHLAFDAFNHVDWYSYRESGLSHAKMFARAIFHQLPGDKPLDVLEWGCGPGRLIRHMPELLGARARSLVGTDYNPESIGWCKTSLPGIQFEQNNLQPPLPFSDESFDVVYNFSVFTHLSELVQLDWANELERVLRPGGLLICTTHGENYLYLLTNQGERERFASGKVVVQGNYQEGKKWFFAVHPESFVRSSLLAKFTDVQRYPTEGSDRIFQDLWVAKKPESLV